MCVFFLLPRIKRGVTKKQTMERGEKFLSILPPFPLHFWKFGEKRSLSPFFAKVIQVSIGRGERTKKKKTVLPFLKARKFAELLERQTAAASKKLFSSLLQTIRGSNEATTTVWKRMKKKRPLDFLLEAGKQSVVRSKISTRF